MKIETVMKNGIPVAVVSGEELLIKDVGTALDLMAQVKYETESSRLVLPKEAITEDFFRLSTCLAGEILQKFVNYGVKMAVVGDFSGYTSKPLKDFIYESNRGSDFCFVADLEKGIDKLASM
nr:DUF4180 domain-containing protein [uncultured Clostridium sp.]